MRYFMLLTFLLCSCSVYSQCADLDDRHALTDSIKAVWLKNSIVAQPKHKMYIETKVALVDLTKIPENIAECLKNLKGIPRKKFTSQLCFKLNTSPREFCLPINDKRFNYSYINTHFESYFKDGGSSPEVSVTIGIYSVKNKEGVIKDVFLIEKISR